LPEERENIPTLVGMESLINGIASSPTSVHYIDKPTRRVKYMVGNPRSQITTLSQNKEFPIIGLQGIGMERIT
jgi:hypothetical protein